MGANIRLHERKVERQLGRSATRGVRPDWVGRAPERRGTLESRLADAAAAGVQDRRAAIPPLGLREYWYPAMPASKVPRRRPLYWKMLGEELVFFHDGRGGIAALTDVCPHRGASLSQGRCFYRGTVTCPYHGAAFDSTGECKAFLTEGPDSKMPGNLRARRYPTRVLRDWVFVWMGESDPAPIEDDVIPELFEGSSTMVQSTYTYWHTSWIVAIENQNDAHNAFLVHRNAMMNLTTDRNRKRTPIGPRSRLVKDRALVALMQNQNYYAKDGRIPYTMHYPGVEGVWPLHTWRKAIWFLFKPWYKYFVFSQWHLRMAGFPYQSPDDWAPLPKQSCWHLPSGIRINHGYWTMNRVTVPVEENLSRVVYFNTRRTKTALARLWRRVWFRLYFNWWINYNFSGQDSGATNPCRYWTPENFAPTDSHLILLRKLITERSRDAKLASGEAREWSTANERQAFELQVQAGAGQEESLADAEAADAPPPMVSSRADSYGSPGRSFSPDWGEG